MGDAPLLELLQHGDSRSVGLELVLEIDVCAAGAMEVAAQAVGHAVDEDEGIEEREAGPFERRLALQESGEGLRLAVGEQVGVVLGAEPAVGGGPSPGAGLAPDRAASML